MPAPTYAWLDQFALVFPFAGTYDAYGQPITGFPIQISCRWTTVDRDVVEAQRFAIAFDATAVVDRIVPVGSHMWLGDLNQWYYGGVGTGSGSGSAAADQQLMTVKKFTQTPDLKNRFFRYEVALMRLHNSGAN